MINFIRSLLALTIGRQVQKPLAILQLLDIDVALSLDGLQRRTGFRRREICKILNQLRQNGLVEAYTTLFPAPINIVRYTLTDKGKQYLEDRRNGRC